MSPMMMVTAGPKNELYGGRWRQYKNHKTDGDKTERAKGGEQEFAFGEGNGDG